MIFPRCYEDDYDQDYLNIEGYVREVIDLTLDVITSDEDFSQMHDFSDFIEE